MGIDCVIAVARIVVKDWFCGVIQMYVIRAKESEKYSCLLINQG